MAAKSKRTSLGSNPLSAADAFLDEPEPEAPPTTSPRKSPRRSSPTSRKSRAKSNGSTPPAEERPKKVRGTFQMEEPLLQRARNTVVALSGPPHRLTLAALVDQALSREIQRLEKKLNDGEPFPQTDEPLRQGRPIGS